MTLSSQSRALYTLSVLMTSPRDLVSSRIGTTPPPKQLREKVLTVRVPNGRQTPILFSILPDPRVPVPADFASRMVEVARAGMPHLRTLDYARATPSSMYYVHQSGYGLKRRDAEIEPLLGWMLRLVTLLEEISPPLPSKAPRVPPARGQVEGMTGPIG